MNERSGRVGRTLTAAPSPPRVPANLTRLRRTTAGEAWPERLGGGSDPVTAVLPVVRDLIARGFLRSTGQP